MLLQESRTIPAVRIEIIPLRDAFRVTFPDGMQIELDGQQAQKDGRDLVLIALELREALGK